MGRMKEYLMDMEEEHYANNEWEAIEHDKVSIFTDLFDLDDLNHFHLLELHMIDGSVHHIYEDMLELVTGLAIRWREPSQLHKGNTIKQVEALMSVPIAHIVCMTVYYEL